MNREEIRITARGAVFSALASDGAPELSVDASYRLADAIASRVADALTAPAPTWELVHDVAYERVRRMRVPLGWLYQTQIDQLHAPGEHVPPGARVLGWHSPVFVPGDGGAL